MPRIDAFLKLGLEQGCSDVHLAVGAPPMLRMHGELLPIKFRDLGSAELEGYIFEVLTESQIERFQAGNDLDFSYMSEDVGRFRVNLYRKATGIGATLRHIPLHIPNLDTLGLPEVVKRVVEFNYGLVLVTGSTGTGKSTTLAAIIDHINVHKRRNIITLEDPVEFIHPSKRSQVIQREVGTHVRGFSEGLRAALRQDPDIILVGEMRDPETIRMAMVAAETGHLVLGTLHTTSATKSIDRILDTLPGEQRKQGIAFMAQHLRGVITQALVKTLDGRGRVPILEVMLMTNAISNMIMTGKSFQIPNQIQTGRNIGMQLLDQALLEAVEAKRIDPNDAYLHASDKKRFQRFVSDPMLLPKVDLAGG